MRPVSRTKPLRAPPTGPQPPHKDQRPSIRLSSNGRFGPTPTPVPSAMFTPTSSLQSQSLPDVAIRPSSISLTPTAVAAFPAHPKLRDRTVSVSLEAAFTNGAMLPLARTSRGPKQRLILLERAGGSGLIANFRLRSLSDVCKPLWALPRSGPGSISYGDQAPYGVLALAGDDP